MKLQFINAVVLQVTGPRQPVWEIAPSDVESVTSGQLDGTVSPRKMQGTTMFDQ